MATKQIFIEVVSDRHDKLGNPAEIVYVDWNNEFPSMDHIILALQKAIGAIINQQQVMLQQGEVQRPDFVKRPN